MPQSKSGRILLGCLVALVLSCIGMMLIAGAALTWISWTQIKAEETRSHTLPTQANIDDMYATQTAMPSPSNQTPTPFG